MANKHKESGEIIRLFCFATREKLLILNRADRLLGLADVNLSIYNLQLIGRYRPRGWPRDDCTVHGVERPSWQGLWITFHCSCQ